MKRSDLLALLLAGDDAQISWEECQILLKSDPMDGLKNTVSIRATVWSLANATDKEVFESYQEALKARQTAVPEPTPNVTSNWPQESHLSFSDSATVPYETYNTYFGFLHSHTRLSDGEGTVAQAYQYARDVGGLDIFAVTDHGELLTTWPWNNEWNQI